VLCWGGERWDGVEMVQLKALTYNGDVRHRPMMCETKLFGNLCRILRIRNFLKIKRCMSVSE